EYTDPSSIYPIISDDLKRHLPLRNLYWNSPRRPLRSIASLHIDLVEAGSYKHAPASVEKNDSPARIATEEPLDHGPSSHRGQRTSGLGATKERRHQIPGLRQTPYLKLFFLRCSDLESYRATHRVRIREWVKDNTPPSQSTAAVNAQEFHDAFEWLIVHVVLPDDGRSVSRASNASTSDARDGHRNSNVVTDKVRADFNGNSKTAVDRVAHVQVQRNPGHSITTGLDQDPSSGWSEFMLKAKSLILSSFDLRVAHYEEDIKERDAQRNIPGWNFNTFFVLKEGLARGFESVGLVEDALTGYQELAAGLNSIIEGGANRGQQGDHFRDYTDDIAAELKRALQFDLLQSLDTANGSSVNTTISDDQGLQDVTAPGSNILDTDRKPFRELILANNISVFDFHCYLFAREVSLLLRLANFSDPARDESSTSRNIGSGSSTVTEKVTKSEPQDLLLLSEICRRALDFFAFAARLLRDDLRSSIDPLSRVSASAHPSTSSGLETPIENLVASWTYSACQCILDATDVPSLRGQLHTLRQNIEPSQATSSCTQDDVSSLSRGELPRRTSSLPMRAQEPPNLFTSDTVTAFSSLNAIKVLPPKSPQTGIQDLAAQRAGLVTLKRHILAGVVRRSSSMKIEWVNLAGSLFFKTSDTEDVALHDRSSLQDVRENGARQPNGHGVKSLRDKDLKESCLSEDAFCKAHESLTVTALALDLVGEKRRSAASLMADLAAIRYHAKDYSSAAYLFGQLASFYYDSDWARLEFPILDMYALSLRHLDSKQDFIRVGLQILAKIAYRSQSPSRLAQPVLLHDLGGFGHYLKGTLDTSKSLRHPLSTPLNKYFGDVFLDPYINHFEGRDGFYVFLKLQSLMPESFEAHQIMVKLVNVDQEQRCSIQLSTEAVQLLRRGPNQVLIRSTMTCSGWYKLEKIEVQAANIRFVYDAAVPSDNAFLGAPPITDLINEANSTPILVWPDDKALAACLSLHPSTHLGQPRLLKITISSGRNEISSAIISLRACSAGLRLHTAEAEISHGNDLILDKLQSGNLSIGPLGAAAKVSMQVPYSVESDLAAIKMKIHIHYTAADKDYLYVCHGELPIQLQLSVNVQDSFQGQALFSNFRIGTANSTPARISNYSMDSTEVYRVSLPPLSVNEVDIFASQPLSLIAKINREASEIQGPPAKTPPESVLTLRIRYASLGRELDTAAEDALMLRSKLSTQELESIALSREIQVAAFEDYEWEVVLVGLHLDRRAGVQQWLRKWHALPQVIDARAVADLVVPVEIPPMPVIVTARMDILGYTIGSGEAQPAAVNQTLLAEVTMEYSCRWACKSDDILKNDVILDITYEVQASPDVWLLGGQLKARYRAEAWNTHKFPIILLPQRAGRLQYPSIEVQIEYIRNAGIEPAITNRVPKNVAASEVDYLNREESILIIPNLRSSTVNLGSDRICDGARLVESGNSIQHRWKTISITDMSAVTTRRSFVHTAENLDSTSSSTNNSNAASPQDTPQQSPSSTSLSSLESSGVLDVKNVNGKLLDTCGNEFQLPDFTVKQIRDAIPARCFQRSGAKGLGYVARDIASLAITFYLFRNLVIPENVPSKSTRAVLWAVYSFIQGLFGTGLWVLAHECGHQSFSPSKTLNDTVGWFCHSALLVPYFSWKISHGKHHKATGHLERDMVFVPKTRNEYASKVGYYAHELTELMEETPLVTAGTLIGQQLVGWPLYLIANVTGHDYHGRQSEGRGKGKQNGFGGGVNHFDPSSPLYEAKDGKLILLSDLGLAITGLVLFLVGHNFGWTNLVVWYFVPYLWVNHWLVAITFLQHTDPTLPHYEAESWNFARGAAATIDREFGFIGRHLFHGIIETHVLHHFVSIIPFYNADEATEAIKPVMGQHYRSNVEEGPIGFLKSMWRSARMCHWIEPCEGAEGEKKGVLFFRNRNGLGVPPHKMPDPPRAIRN
ncbi:MAG: hypothetical protein Q9177_001761, partial [Variospora cf. flavescens]